MGHIISTAKTFASVPGLKVWMDGRFGKDIETYLGNPIVKKWRSLGPLSLTFSSAGVASSPRDITPFINFKNTVDPGTTQIMTLGSIPSEFNFFHSNNFGIFGINSHFYCFVKSKESSAVLKTNQSFHL